MFRKRKADKRPDNGLFSNRPIRGISRGFTGVGGPTQHTVRMVQQKAQRRKEDTKYVSSIPDDRKRFYDLFHNKLDRDEAGIRSMQARTFWEFFAWTMAALALLSGVVYLEAIGFSMPPFGPYALLCPLPWVAAMMIKEAFLNWQVRERRLSAFRIWAVNPAAWLPMLPEREAKAT